MKLNLGAGSTRTDGWKHLDLFPSEGIDFLADLDNCSNVPLPLPDNSCTLMRLEHTLEHILKPLPLFNELHRIAAPNCKIWISCPFGYSEDAWADPTHVRPIIHRFFTYLAQPKYHSFDYGYTGDWQSKYFIYKLYDTAFKEKSVESLKNQNPQSIHNFFKKNPDLVSEICCLAECIKPSRPRQKDLMKMPAISIKNKHFNYEQGFELDFDSQAKPGKADRLELSSTLDTSTTIAIPETTCYTESGISKRLDKKYLNHRHQHAILLHENCLVLDENLAIVTAEGKYLPGGYSYPRNWANHSRVTKLLDSQSLNLKPNISETYLPGISLMLGVSTHYGHMYTDLLDRIVSLPETKFDHYISDSRLNSEQLEIISGLLGVDKIYLEKRVVHPPLRGALKADKVICPSILGNKRCVSKALVKRLQRLANEIILKIDPSKVSLLRQEKIFITRKAARWRRLHLKENLLHSLKQKLFIEYVPENHNLFSQMYTFANAKEIALPAGSECYNLIYCLPATKVFIFISKEYIAINGDFVDHIRSLAYHASLELSFIECSKNTDSSSTMHNQDLTYKGNLDFI